MHDPDLARAADGEVGRCAHRLGGGRGSARPSAAARRRRCRGQACGTLTRDAVADVMLEGVKGGERPEPPVSGGGPSPHPLIPAQARIQVAQDHLHRGACLARRTSKVDPRLRGDERRKGRVRAGWPRGDRRRLHRPGRIDAGRPHHRHPHRLGRRHRRHRHPPSRRGETRALGRGLSQGAGGARGEVDLAPA